jgi:hypothetical protein
MCVSAVRRFPLLATAIATERVTKSTKNIIATIATTPRRVIQPTRALRAWALGSAQPVIR